MTTQNIIHKGLLRRFSCFRPQQSPVARKNLRVIDTMTELNLNTVPQSVFLTELKQAGEEKICDITTRIELHRQVQIAEKLADVYVLLRELDLEWPRFEALYPEAAKDGWLGLLVNRARVLRDEIDEASHAGRG
jgi:hypothetical protein